MVEDRVIDEIVSKLAAPSNGEDFRLWLSGNRKPSPAKLMYHAFEQGMHAGIVGYNYKTDCPYDTVDYRMWWMHGCIVGDGRRRAAAAGSRLLEFLSHMHHCQTCADGPWEDCEVGREAEAMLISVGLYNP